MDVNIAHILFVFIISILLINFLVALLANAVSEVSSSLPLSNLSFISTRTYFSIFTDAWKNVAYPTNNLSFQKDAHRVPHLKAHFLLYRFLSSS